MQSLSVWTIYALCLPYEEICRMIFKRLEMATKWKCFLDMKICRFLIRSVILSCAIKCWQIPMPKITYGPHWKRCRLNKFCKFSSWGDFYDARVSSIMNGGDQKERAVRQMSQHDSRHEYAALRLSYLTYYVSHWRKLWKAKAHGSFKKPR